MALSPFSDSAPHMKLRWLLGAAEHDLGQHRLVELHQRHAGGEQIGELLAQHAHDVLGECSRVVVGVVGDALHPHRAREQVRARQRDLDRRVRQRAQRSRARAARAAGCGRAGRTRRDGGPRRPARRARAAPAANCSGIVDQRQQVGERDQLAVVEAAADEAGVAVAPLLAVGDHVDAGPHLRVDGQPHRVVGRRLEVVFVEPAFQAIVHGLQHPARPRPAADAHHRQRSDRRRGRGRRAGDRECGPMRWSAPRRRRGRVRRACAGALRARPCRRGKLRCSALLAHGHQFVAGQAAPGRQILLRPRSRWSRISSSCPRASGSMCLRISSSRPLPQSRSPPSKLASGVSGIRSRRQA